MSIKYKEYHQKIGNSKFLKILGWISLIAGILVFVTNMNSFMSWNEKKYNYVEQYIYSEFGTLYYEVNEEKVYVQSIYNTDNEKITLDIPNNQVIIMYINKDNINEGIYFDSNNTVDQSMLDPAFNIFLSFFLIAMGLCFVLINKEVKEKKITTNPVFLFYVFLFSLGIALTAGQLNNVVNYMDLKNENNITIATTYSEIYNIGAENNMYKPVSYYYVDNQKYIYVNDLYVEGNLEDNIGKTFELYYNKNNPSEVSKKENPVNILMLIVGICFSAFTFPAVFFKRNMEIRIQEAMLRQENDWKI